MNGSRFQQRGSISFPGGAQGADQECARVGHTEPTARGTCYRCGEKVEAKKLDAVDGRAIEYSKLRSSGVPVDEAAERAGFPLNDDQIVAQPANTEPV